MERRLKERLIGAAVLVLLAVIFIPMILNESTQYNSEIKKSNIPAKPEDEFSSRIIPIEEIQSGREPVMQEDSTLPARDPEPVTSPAGGSQGMHEMESATNIPDVVDSTAKDLPATVPPLKAEDVGVSAWIVQLGSFNSEGNAQKLNVSLRRQGFAAFVEPLQQQSSVIYRVRVGPELLRSDAEDIRDKIKKSNQMDGIVIPYP